MIKLYVFDLDGTLVNSLRDLAESVNKGLVLAGLPAQEIEKYKTFVGNGRDVLLQKAMGEAYDDLGLRELVRKTFDEEYAIHSMDNTCAYDGCAETLKALAERGAKLGVLSNKPDEFVGRILKEIYPDIKFDLAWGQQKKYKRKPSGEALVAMLEQLGIERSECLYFGDSDVDVYTALDAGVPMCGVLWGFRSREELISAGAPRVISEPKEILSL